MSHNTNTSTKKVQAPVWLVDYSAPLINEARTGKRDSDGRFLRQHVSLTKKIVTHSAADAATASQYGCDASDLFA